MVVLTCIRTPPAPPPRDVEISGITGWEACPCLEWGRSSPGEGLQDAEISPAASHSLTHSFTHSFIDSFTNSFTYSFTHSLIQSLTPFSHSLPHSVTYSFIHSEIFTISARY